MSSGFYTRKPLLRMSRIEIIGMFRPQRENLLLILHELQNNNPEHFISEEDMIEIADYLNITYSSVYGVVTYYSMFSRKPRGKYIIRVCRSPVCEMTRSEGTLKHLQKILDIKPGGTTTDRLFTLETTECLGRCDESPGMIINESFYGRLDFDKSEEIIDHLKSGER